LIFIQTRERINYCMGKNSSWLYIGSIGLVIAAIAVTAVIDRTKSDQQDLRAKAGVTTGISATAVVSEVNESVGALLVTNFSLGGDASHIWTIQVSGNSNIASITTGTRVSLKLDPKSVNISSRTGRALEVTTR